VLPRGAGIESHLKDGVVILEVSRNPVSLQQALRQDATLQVITQDIVESGNDVQLPKGPSIFVHLEQYQPVLGALQSRFLMPRHLVVSKDLEPLVQSIINGLPGKEKVRIKSRKEIPGWELHVQERHIPANVQHSFLHVSVPSDMHSHQGSVGAQSW